MANLSLCLLLLGIILNKVSGQAGCEYDDVMYENGDVVPKECFNKTCDNGEWLMDDLDPACCEHHGEFYPEHDAEAWDCMIHVCMGGHWIPTDEKDPDCHDMYEEHPDESHEMYEEHSDDEAKGRIVIRVEQIVH